MKTFVLVFGALALVATTAHAKKAHSVPKAGKGSSAVVAADPELDGKEQEGPAPKAQKDDRHVSSSDADDPEQDGKEQEGPADEAHGSLTSDAVCINHTIHCGGGKRPHRDSHGCYHCR